MSRIQPCGSVVAGHEDRGIQSRIVAVVLPEYVEVESPIDMGKAVALPTASVRMRGRTRPICSRGPGIGRSRPKGSHAVDDTETAVGRRGKVHAIDLEDSNVAAAAASSS